MTRQCDHERLTFTSGGYYVQCMDCGVSWVARKSENDEIDYSRSSEGFCSGQDIRVKPDKA